MSVKNTVDKSHWFPLFSRLNKVYSKTFVNIYLTFLSFYIDLHVMNKDILDSKM